MSLDTTEGIGVVEGNDETMTEESPNKKEPEKELQELATESHPYKMLIKRMLADLLRARTATEMSFADAKHLTAGEKITNSESKTRLLESLETAQTMLDNAYKLGVVTLKENVSLALLLAAQEESDGAFSSDVLQLVQDNKGEDMKTESAELLALQLQAFPQAEAPEVEPEVRKETRTRRQFTCDLCDFTCRTPLLFKRHKQKRHKETGSILPQKPAKQEKLKCVLCEAEFAKKRELNHHMQDSHSDMWFQCDFENCQFTAPTANQVSRHIKSVHLTTEYKCNHCDDTFPTEYRLQSHVSADHEGKSYECDTCGFTTPLKSKLAQHWKKNHEVNNDEPAAFFCQKCEYSCSRQDNLKAHVKRMHSDVLVCPQCPPDENDQRKAFKSPYELKTHVNFVHNGIGFSCDQCEFRTAHEGKLQTHKQVVHEKKTLSCDDCEYKTIKPELLKQHIKSRHSGIMFQCDECPYTTGSKSILKTHIRIQHKNIRYPCDECEYQAQTKNYLSKHKMAKHGVKIRYKCDQCEQKLTSQILLKKHKKLMHEGVRYSCDQCDYSVGTENRLKEHKAVKHEGRKFSCEECDYTAATAIAVKQHKNEKHLGITYPCDLCDYVASRPKSLKQHMKNHEADEIKGEEEYADDDIHVEETKTSVVYITYK